MANNPTAPPAVVPRWGELNDAGGANGYGTPASNLVTPPSGNSDTGFADGTYPPAGWVNWALKALYEWALYLSVFINQILVWTGFNQYQGGLQVWGTNKYFSSPNANLVSNLNKPAGYGSGGAMGTSGSGLASWASTAVDAKATDNAGICDLTVSGSPTLTAGTPYLIAKLQPFSGLQPESVQFTAQVNITAANLCYQGTLSYIWGSSTISVYFTPNTNWSPVNSAGYLFAYHCDY